ncbi:MAG: hypothetical protein AAF224_15050 [Pseudomonadota bacterium]
MDEHNRRAGAAAFVAIMDPQARTAVLTLRAVSKGGGRRPYFAITSAASVSAVRNAKNAATSRAAMTARMRMAERIAADGAAGNPFFVVVGALEPLAILRDAPSGAPQDEG